MIKSKHINLIVAIVLAIAVLISVCMMAVRFGEVEKNGTATVSKSYETGVFDKDELMTVDVIMDEEKWNSMLENAISEQYVDCDVVINGVKYSNVAIRPKGNTSLSQIASSDSDRFSFKIEFDHYVKEQTLEGLDKLVLNNMMSDATYMKEYLSYEMLSYMGVTSSLYSYAKLSVNGEYFGLYFALEGMEESFLERNYGNNYGTLYKPESVGVGGGMGNIAMKGLSKTEMVRPDDNGAPGKMQPPSGDGELGQMQPPGENQENNRFPNQNQGNGVGGMSSSSTNLVYIDDNISSYSAIFDSAVVDANEKDFERIIEALKNINNDSNLEEYMDVDAMLRYLAVNTFLVNLDSYAGSLQHNYYLYEKDGKLTMLPWDFNLAFAGFQSESAVDAVNFPIDTPVSGTTLSERPFIGKLLEKDEYLEQYHQYLDELVSGYINSGQFEVTVNKITKLIDNLVKEDPNALYTYDEYLEGVDSIKQFAALRADSIKGQLEGIIPATTQGQKEDSSSLIEADNLSITAMGTQNGGRGNANKDIGLNANNQANNRPTFADQTMEAFAPNEKFLEDTRTNSLMSVNQIIVLISVILLVFALIGVIFFKRKKYRV